MSSLTRDNKLDTKDAEIESTENRALLDDDDTDSLASALSDYNNIFYGNFVIVVVV